MREILFRGKCVDMGYWVEGFYVCLYDCKGHKSHRIYTGYAETDCGTYYPDWCYVDPATVGQFTGLTDKNGKKIFEGDIVRDEYNGGIAWIAFLQQGCGWYLVFKNTDRRMGHRSRNSAYDNDLELEVIGNIHDNPELLEVDGNG